MDKVPPARQTRSRPMTIEAGPSYFSHDGEAQCVLSNLAASRPVSVARKASLWPPVDLPCWSCHFAQDLSGTTWCPFIPRDNVVSGCGRCS
jgi:hypothetical protein